MLTPRTRPRTHAAQLLGLTVACILAAGPARAQAPDVGGYARPDAVAGLPPALALPDTPQAAPARQLAAAGRHAEAAERLAAAFQSTGDDRYLVHAGLMRSAAGLNALAVRDLEQALARRGDTESRVFIEAQLAQARARTTGVRLRLIDRRSGELIPPHILASAAILVRSASPTAGSRPPEFTLIGYSGQPIALDPTAWSVQIRPPGYRPVELRRSPMWGVGEETWEVAVAPEQVTVTLRVAPARVAKRATLKLTPTGGPGQKIERPLERAESTYVLTGGSWQLDIEARRREVHTSFFAVPGMAPLQLKMTKKYTAQRGRKFERNEKFEIASGVMFLAQVLAGAGVTLAGAVKWQRADDRNVVLLQSAIVDDATGDADGKPAIDQVEASYATPAYHGDLKRALNLEVAGFAVMSSGLAIFVPALTVAARARRRAAFIELGVGAAVLAGGAAWMAVAIPARNAHLADVDPVDRLDRLDVRKDVAGNLGAAFLTGAGAGLLIYSAAALASDTSRRRRYGARLRPGPLAGPGLTGVSLAGRF